VCRRAMFAQAVSQKAWSGGIGPYMSCEVGVSPILGG